jgi:hypothetical protein
VIVLLASLATIALAVFVAANPLSVMAKDSGSSSGDSGGDCDGNSDSVHFDTIMEMLYRLALNDVVVVERKIRSLLRHFILLIRYNHVGNTVF